MNRYRSAQECQDRSMFEPYVARAGLSLKSRGCISRDKEKRFSQGTFFEPAFIPSCLFLEDLFISKCFNRTSGVKYRDADKSLPRPTSRCILFDGENISFDVSLVIHINSTNIPPIMITNRIYEHQNLLSL